MCLGKLSSCGRGKNRTEVVAANCHWLCLARYKGKGEFRKELADSQAGLRRNKGESRNTDSYGIGKANCF